MSASTVSNWWIRSAARSDFPSLRLLLPQAVHLDAPVRCWAACDGNGAVVGALAATLRMRGHPLTGPRVAVEIAPPWRSGGLAAGLVAAAAESARRQGAAALYAWEAVEMGSAQAAQWAQLGFDHGVGVEEASGEISSTALAYVQRMYDGVVERGWIPADAQIVPLPAADPLQVAQLHAAYLGSTVPEVLRQLRGQTLVQYHPLLSPVLKIGPQVMGFTLAEVLPHHPSTARVHATVVHPALRNGWANLWLKQSGLRRCVELGITTLLEQSYAHHTDTRRLAKRWGTRLRHLIEPYRPLA